MNKTLSLLTLACAGLMLATSCKQIETIEELNDYKECFSYSVDTISGTGCVSDFASVKVKGDITSAMYMLEFNDFRLYEGAMLTSSTLSNLPQFMADIRNDKDEIIGAKYYFFKYQNSTRQSGTMEISDFRFGWLSSIFWLNFTSGPYKVWSLPRRYSLYGVKTEVASPYPGPNVEQSINPKYTMSLNATKSEVSVKASLVKYPVDNTDPQKSLEFKSLEWPDLPVEFNANGYTINVAEFTPVVDGKTDEWIIQNFNATISADYDGPKTARFTMRRKDGSLTLRITTNFSYVIPSK